MSASVATRPPLRRAVGRVVGPACWVRPPPRAGCCASRPCWWSPRSCSACWACSAGWPAASAVHDARTRIAALTTGAADLYQSLADADAMATTGYVSGGLEPAAVRARYDDDIQRAGRLLTSAAGLLPPGDPAIAAVSTVGEQLPVYTGLVENARALNRLGLPLGQSYLASASKLMQTHDPARRRGGAHAPSPPRSPPPTGRARPSRSRCWPSASPCSSRWPISRCASGGAPTGCSTSACHRGRARGARLRGVVGGRGDRRRRAHRRRARAHSDAGAALDDARIAVLQARSNESLVLVARNSGGGSSDEGFTAQLDASSTTAACSPTAERADPDARRPGRRPARRRHGLGRRPPRRPQARRRRPVPAGRRLGRRPRAGHVRRRVRRARRGAGRDDRRGAGRVRRRRRGGGGCAGRAAVDLGGAGAGRGGRRDRRDRTTGG